MLLPERKIAIDNWFNADDAFNQLYPKSIQLLARRHWTPLHVIRKAILFLAVRDRVRILDIGSGPGKFCLASAYFRPNVLCYGVEQRKSLVDCAESAREILGFQNVSFLHGNFTQLDFGDYDHFYFFNSFYENLAGTEKIDDSIAYSGDLYRYYNRYLFQLLEKKPAGTRLVTFHSLEDDMPEGYHIAGVEMNNLLKYWIKV